MKKVFVSLLVASLLLGGYSGKVAAYNGNSKNNIIVGSVKNQSLNTVNNFSSVQGIKKYNLDFSCLKVNMKNKKLVTQVDYEKIANVAKAKNFNSDKKNTLTENAVKTKSLLDSELSDLKLQQEIDEIIQEHQKKTGQNPIIGLTCVPITQDSNGTASSTKANRLFKANRLMLNTMNTYASISGPTEGDGNIILFTSVSGSGSTVWGQSNVYLNYPTIGGVQINLPDAISLSWNSPWLLTNNYSITLDDTLGNVIPSYINSPTRTGGSNTCLAYSFTQYNVKGAYLGASLANGPTGGNDLFSKFIITTVAFPYSFSASGGSAGVSISPSTDTASVQSSVYFTN
jgi:hypothetical protein